MLVQLHTLYEFVWDAREACGGAFSAAKKKQVLEKIHQAWAWAEAHNEHAVAEKLLLAQVLMEHAAGDYYCVKRQQADDVLCALLNNDLKEYE